MILQFSTLQLKNRVGIGFGVVNQPLALLVILIENIIATLHFVQSLTAMMDLQHTSLRPTTVFVNFMRTCIIPKITNLSTLDWEIVSAYSIVIVSLLYL